MYCFCAPTWRQDVTWKCSIVWKYYGNKTSILWKKPSFSSRWSLKRGGRSVRFHCIQNYLGTNSAHWRPIRLVWTLVSAKFRYQPDSDTSMRRLNIGFISPSKKELIKVELRFNWGRIFLLFFIIFLRQYCAWFLLQVETLLTILFSVQFLFCTRCP